MTENPAAFETDAAPPPAGQVLDAHLHVLDRQVLDRDDVPVTTADDLEFDGIEVGARIEPGSPRPTVSAILTGPQLVMRLFGGHAPAARGRREAHLPLERGIQEKPSQYSSVSSHVPPVSCS